MEIILTFLEGIASFVSPCLLPLIPIYLAFIIGDDKNSNRRFLRSLSFVIGFTVVFISLGVFSSLIGMTLVKYRDYIEFVFGCLIIIIGLNYLELINVKFLNISKRVKSDMKVTSVGTAFLFGVFFALGYTPCIGAFLGSALMMASTSGSTWLGFLYLLSYSLGMGLPFILSSLFIEKAEFVSTFVKRNYKLVNMLSGGMLILIGFYKIYFAFGGLF